MQLISFQTAPQLKFECGKTILLNTCFTSILMDCSETKAVKLHLALAVPSCVLADCQVFNSSSFRILLALCLFSVASVFVLWFAG